MKRSSAAAIIQKDVPRLSISHLIGLSIISDMRCFFCKRNIEMTPPCKVEVTLPRVVGSGEVHRGGGVVDEQAGVQPP